MVIDILEQLSEIITGYDIEVEKTSFNNRLAYEIKILDNKEEPIIVIGRPTPNDMSKYQAQMRTNILTATKNLYKSCYVSGDKELLNKDEYFISLVGAVSDIIERRKGHLSKL
jgi:hypothetical protein